VKKFYLLFFDLAFRLWLLIWLLGFGCWSGFGFSRQRHRRRGPLLSTTTGS